MVQSPRREDAKWENTGLRAGEAETDTQQRQSGRLDAGKPLLPRLCDHTSCQRARLGLPDGLPGGGRKMSLLERSLHVTLKVLPTTWKWKILFESVFGQTQITATFIQRNSFLAHYIKVLLKRTSFQILWYPSSCKLFTIFSKNILKYR